MKGHRQYLDNAKLISTEVRKPPIPRHHRKWIDYSELLTRSRASTEPLCVSALSGFDRG